MRAALGKFIPVLLSCSSLGCSRKDDIDRTDTTKGVPISSFHSLEPDRIEKDLYSVAEPKLLTEQEEIKKDDVDRTESTKGVPISGFHSREPDRIEKDLYTVAEPKLSTEQEEIKGKPLSLDAFIKDEFKNASFAKLEPKSFVIKSGELPIPEPIDTALRGHLQEKVKHRLYTVTPVRDTIEPDEENTGIECDAKSGVWFVKVGDEMHALWIDIVYAKSLKDAAFFASISPDEDDSWRSNETAPSPLANADAAEETQYRTMHNWIHDIMTRKAVGVRWAEVYGAKPHGTEDYEWKKTPMKYFVIRPSSEADPN